MPGTASIYALLTIAYGIALLKGGQLRLSDQGHSSAQKAGKKAH